MRMHSQNRSKSRGVLRFLSHITIISTVLGAGSATGYFTAQYIDNADHSLISKFADLQIKSKLGLKVRKAKVQSVNVSKLKKTNHFFMAKTGVMHASDLQLVAEQKLQQQDMQQTVTASKAAFVRPEPIAIATAPKPLITHAIKPYPLPAARADGTDARTIVIQPASLNLGKNKEDVGATISLRASVSEPPAEQKVAALPPVKIAPLELMTTEKFRASTEARRLAEEKYCLAQAIYFEARSEPSLGQMAVANVVMNRVRSKHYPNTICGVVFQGEERRNKCQFSFACDGKTDRPRKDKHWRRAERIALGVMRGKKRIRALDDTLHYHADYVRPRWSRSMKRVKKIGRHIFFFDRTLKERS